MKTQLLTLLLLPTVFSLTAQKKAKVKESTGVYQFLNDDPNASPFFAKKEPVIAQNGISTRFQNVATYL